jgi:hypothetical protein
VLGKQIQEYAMEVILTYIKIEYSVTMVILWLLFLQLYKENSRAGLYKNKFVRAKKITKGFLFGLVWPAYLAYFAYKTRRQA